MSKAKQNKAIKTKSICSLIRFFIIGQEVPFIPLTGNHLAKLIIHTAAKTTKNIITAPTYNIPELIPCCFPELKNTP